MGQSRMFDLQRARPVRWPRAEKCGRRLGCWLLWIACLVAATTIGRAAEIPATGLPATGLPATVRVLADHTYLRSGPGDDYYPTERLLQGDTVEVWAIDPAGHVAVRPVEGSFSWVRGDDLRHEPPAAGGDFGAAKVGVVIADGALSRVGSQINELRHVAQVRLEAGERVQVLGHERIERGRHAGTWVRIAPPAGEFRWARLADLESPPGVEPARLSAAVAAEAARAAISEAGESVAAVMAQARAPLPDPGPPAEAPAMLGSIPDARRLLAGWLPLGTGVIEGAAPRAVSAPETAATGDELADIDLALSVAVTGPPETWNLAMLRERLRLAAARSSAPSDRLRVEAIDARLARFEAIQSRQQALAAPVPEAAAPLRIGGMWSSLSGLGSRPIRPGVLPGGAPADGQPTWTPGDVTESTGRLATVVSRRPDAPRWAIVDANNAVIMFVTPQPGVNLAPLVGQQITVRGSRGYMPEYKRPYLVASEIRPRLAATPTEDGGTRR
jgi:hypothetical protein